MDMAELSPETLLLEFKSSVEGTTRSPHQGTSGILSLTGMHGCAVFPICWCGVAHLP